MMRKKIQRKIKFAMKERGIDESGKNIKIDI